MPTIDINTSGETIDGTPPGATYRPLRYTTSLRDEIRVGVWNQLSTVLGSYRLVNTQGLDVEALLDPDTSDEERQAIVGDVVLGFPGVLGFLDGPTVTLNDDKTEVSITLTANTVDGPVTLSL